MKTACFCRQFIIRFSFLQTTPRGRRWSCLSIARSTAAGDSTTLVVNVVNRHRDQAIQTEFELEDKQFSGAVEAIEVNGPDIKAANTLEGAPVKPTQRSAPAQGKTLQYSFPPHSFTMLRAKLA